MSAVLLPVPAVIALELLSVQVIRDAPRPRRSPDVIELARPLQRAAADPYDDTDGASFPASDSPQAGAPGLSRLIRPSGRPTPPGYARPQGTT